MIHVPGLLKCLVNMTNLFPYCRKRILPLYEVIHSSPPRVDGGEENHNRGLDVRPELARAGDASPRARYRAAAGMREPKVCLVFSAPGQIQRPPRRSPPSPPAVAPSR